MACVEERIIIEARAIQMEETNKLIAEQKNILKISETKLQDGILAAWQEHGISYRMTKNDGVNTFLEKATLLYTGFPDVQKKELTDLFSQNLLKMSQKDIPYEFKKFYDLANRHFTRFHIEVDNETDRFREEEEWIVTRFHTYVQIKMDENGIDIDDDVF